MPLRYIGIHRDDEDIGTPLLKFRGSHPAIETVLRENKWSLDAKDIYVETGPARRVIHSVRLGNAILFKSGVYDGVTVTRYFCYNRICSHTEAQIENEECTGDCFEEAHLKAGDPAIQSYDNAHEEEYLTFLTAAQVEELFRGQIDIIQDAASLDRQTGSPPDEGLGADFMNE